ncbi:BsuPI-related putative proteinase inhibitor [Bacillus spongiae]|uniref:Intracellular proteinase inhibitor BsuPI domain-containing protein n=1 Tax=Bacillus spongiae TaxID=2683610 RepID=A0ABU8HBF1_9BACI
MKNKWLCFFFCISFILVNSINVRAVSGQKVVWKVEPTVVGDEVKINLSLHNNSSREVLFQFATNKMYDYVILHDGKREVYRYSLNKKFSKSDHTLKIMPGQTKVWTSIWKNETPVHSGLYKIKARFLPTKTDPNIVFEKIADNQFILSNGNEVFRNIKIKQLEKGKYRVKGEARTREGSFYYSVDDGHHELMGETLVKVNKKEPNWSKFSFNLTVKNLKHTNKHILTLYERNQNDGTFLHQYSILLKKDQ